MIDKQNSLPQLPKGWVWTTFGDISGELRAGGTPSTKVKEYYENGTIPFVKIEDIVDSKKYLYNTTTKITEEGLRNCSAWVVPKDSLLYSMYASYGEPIINKTEVATSQAIIAYIPPDNLMVLDYVYYYLKKIKPELTTRGTTQRNLNAQIVRNIPVPLPPFAEQGRIVAKVEELLTELDAGIESFEKVRTQLKRYRQAVLKYSFEGKLTEEWRKTNKDKIEPASVLLERIKEGRKHEELLPLDTSELPELPEDWEWTRTGEICEGIVPGRTKPKEFRGPIPWITLPDVRGLYVSKSQNNLAVTKEDAEKVGMKVMPKGTVLISCVGQFGIVSIASCPIVPNQQFHGLVCRDNIPPEYVAFSLMTKFEQMKKLSSATTIAYMNKTKCNSISIPLAPLAEQYRIVEEIERRFSVADEVEEVVDKGLKQAEQLRQSFLKVAFEGKLVPQDSGDEPAEKLLERIRKERAKSKGEEDINKKKNKAKQLELVSYVE